MMLLWKDDLSSWKYSWIFGEQIGRGEWINLSDIMWKCGSWKERLHGTDKWQLFLLWSEAILGHKRSRNAVNYSLLPLSHKKISAFLVPDFLAVGTKLCLCYWKSNVKPSPLCWKFLPKLALIQVILLPILREGTTRITINTGIFLSCQWVWAAVVLLLTAYFLEDQSGWILGDKLLE